PDREIVSGLHHGKTHPLLVASGSVRSVRTIGFAHNGDKLDKSLPMVPLASRSLLLFADAINENFKHTIIEDKSVRGPRISVTFREFADPKEPKVTKPSQALDSNASESQSPVPDTSVAGEFAKEQPASVANRPDAGIAPGSGSANPRATEDGPSGTLSETDKVADAVLVPSWMKFAELGVEQKFEQARLMTFEERD